MELKTIKEIEAEYPGINRGIQPQKRGYDTIIRDRYARIQEMKDKYIISTVDKRQRRRFYQAAEFRGPMNYEWSQFLGNAMSFKSFMDAEMYAVNEIDDNLQFKIETADAYIEKQYA